MNEKLKIGNVKLNTPFLLAPLAGITDAPMRRLCAEQGAALTYSEMVSAKGLWYKDKNTEKLLFSYPNEGPFAIQLFGNEPEIMAFGAEKLEDYPNVILDFNMGCPVPKVVKNGEGSALMKNPELVYDIIKAMVKATSKPVTAKIRLGWSRSQLNGVEVAKAIEEAGGAAVAVHGRTRDEFYSGQADWEEIARIKEAVDIPIIGNGDVVDSMSAKALMDTTNCDFVMIGRGALGNPWIFHELNCWWTNGEIVEKPSVDEKKRMMIRQLLDIQSLKGEYAAVREMRKHVGWYMKGVHGSAAFRGAVNQISDCPTLIKVIQEL